MSESHIDPDARAHSERLQALIRSEIQSAGGAIPFWRFMELALYAPGLGYYSAGATKFGAAGDFITAPELGPLFAECVAEAVVPVLQQLGPQAHFVEVGGGSGRFAGDAITRMAQMDALPARYSILEPSADLRERQGEYLRQRLDASQFRRVHWLERPPQDEWHGVLFANEVIDALPTPRFAIVDGEVMEEHVALDGDGGFKRVDRRAEAGTGAGFEFSGYCSQASFLIGNKLDERLAAHEAGLDDEAALYALRQQAKQLTLPAAMGEGFQAMGFARGVDFEHAFLAGDLSHRL